MSYSGSLSLGSMDSKSVDVSEDDILNDEPQDRPTSKRFSRFADDATRSSMTESDDGLQEDDLERTAISCFRYFVVFLLLMGTVLSSVFALYYLTATEEDAFRKEVCHE